MLRPAEPYLRQGPRPGTQLTAPAVRLLIAVPHQKGVHLVGGGARNRLLCDLTAQISGVTVVRGPIEASTFGSLLAQLETIGALAEEDRASVIAASAATHVHVPTRS